MASHFVRRVDKLDASMLDEELGTLLNIQYRKAFRYLPNSILAHLGPELDVLFKLLFKYIPLQVLRCSFGQSLFKLQYRELGSHQPASNNKLRLFAIASVCFPWLWERIVRKLIIMMPNGEISHRLLESSYFLEGKLFTIYQFLSLLNFCAFLQNAKYQSLTERLLLIRPLYTEQQNIRSVQTDNLERELLWHGLSEFLGFTLPLINVHKVKGFLKRTCMPKYYKDHYKKYFIHSNTCSICGDIPNFPHTFGCFHVFCYYCIASIVLADPSYLCLDCDVKANGIESVKPLPANRAS